MLGKLLICFMLFAFAHCCSVEWVNGVVQILNTPPCPFVVGAKVQVTLMNAYDVEFTIEIIGDHQNVSLPSYLIDFGDGSNSTFSTSPGVSVPPFFKYTATVPHMYPSATASYRYFFHLATSLTSPLTTFTYSFPYENSQYAENSVGDLLLNGTINVSLLQGSGVTLSTPSIDYWDNPSLPAPYPYISTSTEISVPTATSCTSYDYRGENIYSASFNSATSTCQVAVNAEYFVPNVVRLDFANTVGQTASAFVVQPTCCQNSNDILHFIDNTGTGLVVVNSATCTTLIPEALISPQYAGGCPNISSVSVTNVNSTIPAYTCGNVTYNTTITDVCGISSTFVQIVQVKDLTPPTIHFPNGTQLVQPSNQTVMNLQCREEIPSSYSGLYGLDSCTPGHLTVTTSETNVSVPGAICKNDFLFVYSYSAIDLCDRSVLVDFSFQIRDTIAPTFDPASLPPESVSIQCRNQLPQYTLTGSDNCLDAPTITETLIPISTSSLCSNNGILNRTWTIADPCGNSNTFTQTAYINNTVPATFNGIPSKNFVSVSCTHLIPPPPNITEYDVCNGLTYLKPNIIYHYLNDNPLSCIYNVSYEYTFNDACYGNSSTYTQVISVEEINPPQFFVEFPVGAPLPQSGTYVFQCTANYLAQQQQLGALSACGETLNVVANQYGPTTYNTSRPGTCPYNTILVRNWTTVDECGNSKEIQQTYIVQDTIAPTFTNLPANNTYFQCLAQVPAAAAVTAFDNCDPNVQAYYEGQQTSTCANNDCSNKIIIYRSWNATDNCGNLARVNQTIVVFDDTAPQFTSNWTDLDPGVISCSKASSYRVPCRTAVDNCGGQVTVTTDIYGNLATPEGLIVDYTATDSCGNVNYERVTIKSDCTGAPEVPILANFEPNPPLCRPLLPIESVVPTIVVGNDTDYAGCTLVNGAYDCSNRTSFTVFPNGTVINYPFPLDSNPPPNPCCNTFTGVKRDLHYEDTLKRATFDAPQGYVPIVNPDYSFFYCPQEILQCYSPASAGGVALDPFRLCPSYLYTTVPNKRFESMAKKGINPPAINNTMVISQACIDYLQIPICAPAENSSAGAFFYQTVYQDLQNGKYPTTSKGNRKFFSRFFTDLECKTFDVVLPNGTFVEIIDESGQCVGPLCQTITLTSSTNGVNGGVVTSGTPPACVDQCITISGPDLTSQCVTFQSPTSANCFPNVIQTISADGTVTCGQQCLQGGDVATNCQYGIQQVLGNDQSACINLDSLNYCDVNNVGQLRVVFGNDGLVDGNGAPFNVGSTVFCSCTTSGMSTVCAWSCLVDSGLK